MEVMADGCQEHLHGATKGFESKIHPEYVCKLKKALYGLKQAPRAWYRKIGEFLVQSGVKIASSDSSLFVREKEK